MKVSMSKYRGDPSEQWIVTSMKDNLEAECSRFFFEADALECARKLEEHYHKVFYVYKVHVLIVDDSKGTGKASRWNPAHGIDPASVPFGSGTATVYSVCDGSTHEFHSKGIALVDAEDDVWLIDAECGVYTGFYIDLKKQWILTEWKSDDITKKPLLWKVPMA
jgi:hypothetical protein